MTIEEICTHCGTDHFPEPCPVAGMASRALPTSFDLPVGAPVGEYRVTGFLGKGGMGAVYSGVHPMLGRKVAIKVLIHQASHSDEASARFLQEARAASTLRHPNIVDVFAFGQLPDGRYYQVMDLLEGESLRAILDRRGSLDPKQARAIVTGVLSGLAAAHRRGVIHRDIKPDNIFICGVVDGDPSSGDVKILDFGVAKHDTGERPSVKTRTGAALGTPAYMSPEQCRGVASIDGRTDLYATGVMLFEMLAGHTPFQSESAFDVMAMQINARVPSLAKVIGRPEPLEPVIVRALEKRPDERYGTASEMLAALTGMPVAAGFAAASGAIDRQRLPRDFADRETVPAVAAQPSLAAGDGLAPAVVPGGARPVAARTFTGAAWRSRALPYLGAGAALGLVVVGAALLVGGTPPRPPAAPAPGAKPAPLPPAAPPPAAGLGDGQPAEPAGAAEVSRAPAQVQGPPDAPATAKGVRPLRGKAAERSAKGGRRAGRRGDVDLDVPWNPYAH